MAPKGVEIQQEKPERFVIHGKAGRAAKDLVFERDDSAGYLVYRAKVHTNGTGAPLEKPEDTE